MVRTALAVAVALACLAAKLTAQESTREARGTSSAGEMIHLNGYDVRLAAPVLVAESKTGHLSIPKITALANGDLVVIMSDHADVAKYPNSGAASFSRDGGETWSEPVPVKHRCPVTLRLASGDELFLPYMMAMKSEGVLSAPYTLIRKGTRTLETIDGVEVTGWPEPPASAVVDGTLCGGFVFEGQTAMLNDGSFFATLYGSYKSGGIRIVGAVSSDGIHWKIVSTIAKRSGAVNERGEGPTEAAVCRLKDGRLMCIYRLDSNFTYGQTWSSDDGRTWTEPVECKGPRSVEPCLAVLKNGTVLLSGGRPGVKLWVNTDGTGNDWQEIDIGRFRYRFVKNSSTTGYTGLAFIDEAHLLYVYDYGFEPPCRVEVVGIEVR